jgi:hypothetical protein
LAYTLAEVNRLTTDRFIQGVAEDRVQENPLMARLPFENVTGTQVTWNRESTTGSLSSWKTATFSQIGGALSESTPSTTQVSATLAQLTDSAKVARFAVEVKGDINPVEQFTHDMKVKALFETFQDALFYGDNNANSNEFDGLHRWVDNTLDTDLDISEGGAALNITNLLQMMDAVRTPTILISNRRIHARMSQAQYLAGAVGTATAQNLNVKFGARLEAFGTTDWLVTDYLTMTETNADPPVETGSSNASVLALKLDDYSVMGPESTLYAQGPTIIQSAMGPHIVGPIAVPGEANVEFQYYWYVALITPARRTVGRLRGITDAAVSN